MKSRHRSKHKKQRRLKPPLLNVAKSMGKWKPHDDYLLVQAIQQTSCLNAVHKLTKFSSNFSLKEIQERWYAILYDAPISKMINKKISAIHADDLQKLKEKAPFSDAEMEQLAKIASNAEPSIDELNELLSANRLVFHESRTGEKLKDHWEHMRQFKLLNDQNVIEKGAQETFEDKESKLNDKEIMDNVELNVEIEEEMCKNYKKLLNQIKRSEAELYLWQVLADHATSTTNAFEDIECLAVLECENFKYVVKSRDISMGRSSEDNKVDLDFSLIGHAKKISKNQGAIRMNDEGQFFIFNNSRRPMFVDGKVLLNSCKTQLFDKSIIQIDDFSLLFFINFNNVLPLMSDSRKAAIVTSNANTASSCEAIGSS